MAGHIRRRGDKWAIVVDLPRSVDGKREISRTHLTTVFGATPLAKLNASDIDAAYGRWLKTGRLNGTGGP
jgi:hypothetical protein